MKYEYDTVFFLMDLPGFTAALNEKAKDGWRVINTNIDSSGLGNMTSFIALFEREIKEPAQEIDSEQMQRILESWARKLTAPEDQVLMDLYNAKMRDMQTT